MKITKILIVSLILLLTIGAVSAAGDNVTSDNLTANETQDILSLDDDITYDEEDPDDEYDPENEDDYEDEPDYWFSVKDTYDITDLDAILIDGEMNYGDGGNISIFIDGSLCKTHDLNYYGNIYFSANDLGLTNLTYKSYTVNIVYSSNNISENFNETYVFKANYGFDASYHLDHDEEIDITYGKGIEFRISVPSNAEGNLTYEINGRRYSIPVVELYEGEYVQIDKDKLDLGKNEITFSYEGEDYPLDYVTWNVTTQLSIEIDKTDIGYNESATIYLYMPADANGNLSVYEAIIDENSIFSHYRFVDTTPVENGFAKIEFTSNTLGTYNIHANYTGSDYTVNLGDVDEFDEYIGPIISVNPIVKVAHKIQNNTSNNLTIMVPEEYVGILTLTIGDEQHSVNVTGGMATIELFNYAAAKSEMFDTLVRFPVDLKFESENYTYHSNDLDILASTYGPDLNITIDMSPRLKGEGGYSYGYDGVPDDLEGKFNVYLNGTFQFVADSFRDCFDLNYSSLDLGRYTHTLEYLGDSYYNPTTVSHTFEVTDVIIGIYDYVGVGNYSDYVPEEYYLGSIETIYDDGYYRLIIDGEVVDMEILSGHFSNSIYEHITTKICLSRGPHEFELIYKSGNIVKSLNKTVNVGYEIKDNTKHSYYKGENVTLSFKVPLDVTGNLNVTVGNAEHTIPIINGEASIILNNLELGEHTYTVKYDGAEYPDLEYEDTFRVYDREGISFNNLNEFEDNNLKYGDNITITAYLPRELVGKLYVYERNEDDEIPIETVDVVNGSAQVTLSNLSFGSHSICAKIIDYDSELYDIDSYESIYINVKPLINGKPSRIYEYHNYGGEDITVNVELPSDANGTLYLCRENPNNWEEYITIDGFAVAQGNSTITLTGLPLGSYHYYIRYDDGKYNFTEELGYVHIEAVITFPDKMNMGDDEYVTVYAPSGNLTAFGTSASIKDGVARIPLSNLTVGKHYNDIIFRSGDYYKSFNSVWLEPNYIYVYKPKPSIHISETSNPLTLEFSNDATGDILVKIGNETIAKPIVEGKVIIDDLNVNPNEDIVLSYVGNDKFGSFKKSVKLGYAYESILPDSSANQTKNESRVMVFLNVANIYMGSGVSITSMVFNENNEIIDGTVDLYINSTFIGTANINKAFEYTPSEIGKYAIEARFAGDSTYKSSSGKATFNVIPSIVPEEITSNNEGVIILEFPINATGTLTIFVDGKPVKEINVTEELEKFKNETQGDVMNIIIGILKIDLSKYKGQHVITFIYSGDENYEGFTKDIPLTVNIKIPSISASNMNALYTAGSKYTIKVFSDTGVPANGASIVVKINGKTFKTLQTVNGVASFQITQVPDKYTLTITSLGKTMTTTLIVKHLVTLKTVSVKRSAKKLTLQATLAKVNGKYLKNKKITFKFNGKKYTAKTNKKGIAKVTVKASALKKLKAGKKITYQATYLKDTVKKTAKVKK